MTPWPDEQGGTSRHQANRFPLLVNYANILLGRSRAEAPVGQPVAAKALEMSRNRLRDATISPDALTALRNLSRSTEDLVLALLAGLDEHEIQQMHQDGWEHATLLHLAALRGTPLPPTRPYRICTDMFGNNMHTRQYMYTNTSQ